MFVLQETRSNEKLSLGCFGPGLFTFSGKGFLTTYWWTSPSLEKLKSFQILLAPLDPSHQSSVASVNPGTPFLPPTITKLRMSTLASTMHPEQTCASSLQFSFIYISGSQPRDPEPFGNPLSPKMLTLQVITVAKLQL